MIYLGDRLRSTMMISFVSGAHDMLCEDGRIAAKTQAALTALWTILRDSRESQSDVPDKHIWNDSKRDGSAVFSCPKRRTTYLKLITAVETCAKDPVDAVL